MLLQCQWWDRWWWNKGSAPVVQSSIPSFPLFPALYCPWDECWYYWNAAACQQPQLRRLILTHASQWTPPLSLHKVIAVRECALQRVAWAPQAQRVRLGNKRAKSVLLRHSQILRLSLCCCGWGLTVMNIGQKLVFHMIIFPNENWWMREGGTLDCVMRGGTTH